MDAVPTSELLRILAQRMAGLREKKAGLESQLLAKRALLSNNKHQQPAGASAASAAAAGYRVTEEEEEDDDGFDQLCQDLFTARRLPQDQIIANLLSEHKFDLPAFCKSINDHLAMARTVNFIRRQVASSGSAVKPEEVLAAVKSNADNWQQDEQYLKPVLENDSLLWADSFSDDEDFDGEEVAEEDDDDDDDASDDNASSASSSSSRSESGSDSGSVDSYFGGYDNIEIHEEMLRDEHRTLAYRDAFSNSREAVFQDQLVIDVGSGTGILSMLCSRHGRAKRVYAIENCRTLSKMSRKLMRRNGFVLPEQIHVFVGLAQEFAQKHPGVKVNAVVSEWMGYALLYEHQMLSAVLQVRDQTLAPGGRMFPNKSRLLVHAVGDSDQRINYWDEVYGLDFAPMKELRRARVDVMVVNPNALLSPAAVFKEFDFERMQDSELDFSAEFEVTLSEAAMAKAAATATGVVVVEGLCISFDCSFPADAEGEASLTTSPEHLATHWKQSVLWLDEPLEVPAAAGASGKVTGTITFMRKGPSKLDIGLRLTHPRAALSIYEM